MILKIILKIYLKLVSYNLTTINLTKSKSGTLLEITELKSGWSEEDVKRMATSLRRMKSPFKGAEDFGVKLIFINCPSEFQKYEDLESSDIIDKSHYKFLGIVDDKTNLEFEYEFKMQGFKSNKKQAKINLKDILDINISLKTLCGGFFVNFFVYDKNRFSKKYRISKGDLSDYGEVFLERY